MEYNLSIDGTYAHCTGEIWLDGSKSISNRVLLIRALSNSKFDIQNLSTSDDTTLLCNLLSQNGDHYDCHHAGTTFRFLTAYLSLQSGTQYLTGSDRMKQRPIKALVDALNNLGANIEYAEKVGFPPLYIHRPNELLKSDVTLDAGISSQYLSALLMIAPSLANGLTITLEGDLVSRPYVQMTLEMMQHFGIDYVWVGNTIKVPHQTYAPKSFFVEADWSAASYYYSVAAIAKNASITLHGLQQKSLQGDAAIANISHKFDVETEYKDNSIKLTKSSKNSSPFFEYNFIEQPDIAQTVFVMCAAKAYHGLFSGLQTLRIKETDRIAACIVELAKVQSYLTKVPSRFIKNNEEEHYMIEGEAIFHPNLCFDTYHDHRMAMAFAPLSLKGEITINDAGVVSKSYPNYWKDLAKLGFIIKTI